MKKSQSFIRKTLSTAIVSCLALPATSVVLAEESTSLLEEIIVSARKRDESLQEVPVAVTAFSGEGLEKLGVTGIEDLALSNPNVKISPGGAGGVTNSRLTIRGNQQDQSSTNVDPAVGVYVDGHILAHPMVMDGALFDVESVQTLKGPQGSLFGRNSTGGAILFKTVSPNLDELSGYVKAGLGQFDTRSVAGAINIPMSDSFAVRLAGSHTERDGFAEYTDGSEQGDKEVDVFRIKALWQIDDGTSLEAFYERTEIEGSSAVSQNLDNLEYDDIPATRNIVFLDEMSNPVGAGEFDATPNDDFAEGEADFYGLTLTRALGNGELKVLASYRDYSFAQNISLPGFGLPSMFSRLGAPARPQALSQQEAPDNDQLTFELQYNGSFMDDTVQVTSGLYYFDETTTFNQRTFDFNVFDVGGGSFETGIFESGNRSLAEVESKSLAAYIQSTIALTDTTNLTVGVRYTDDDKEAEALLGGVPNPLATPAASVAVYDNSETSVDYLVSVDQQLADGILAYVSTASGYRAATPGDRDLDGDGNLDELEAEEVTNYEIGIKADLFDNLRVNAALYRQEYESYQYFAIVNLPGVGLARALQNTDAIIQGGELEATLVLPGDVEIRATYGLTDGEVDDSESFNDGDSLTNVPDETWSLTVQKSMDILDGTLDLSANYSWQSEFSTSYVDAIDATAEDSSRVEDYGLLNMSAIYSNENYKVRVYVNNVTDEEYITHTSYAFFGLLGNAQLGMPRTAGVEFTYNF